MTLKANDAISFIKKRGEIPEEQELEALLVARHTPRVHEKLKKSLYWDCWVRWFRIKCSCLFS